MEGVRAPCNREMRLPPSLRTPFHTLRLSTPRTSSHTSHSYLPHTAPGLAGFASGRRTLLTYREPTKNLDQAWADQGFTLIRLELIKVLPWSALSWSRFYLDQEPWSALIWSRLIKVKTLIRNLDQPWSTLFTGFEPEPLYGRHYKFVKLKSTKFHVYVLYLSLED